MLYIAAPSEHTPTTLRSGRARAAPKLPGKPGPMPPPRTLTRRAGVAGAIAISMCLVLVTPSAKTRPFSGSAWLSSCISRGRLLGLGKNELEDGGADDEQHVAVRQA